MEKIADKIHFDCSSSLSSDSDAEVKAAAAPEASPSPIKARIWRLFGREKPVHHVFGGGKPADVFFWRRYLLVYLVEQLQYGKRPHIPEVQLPEEPILEIASALSIEINHALSVLRDIATGRDLKKFLSVAAGLWILSVVGNCCNFLTLFYISFVLLHTVPVLYEKYEDKVDPPAEKVMQEIKKQYAICCL